MKKSVKIEINSISVNGQELIIGDRKNNTTSWFEIFMEFCIDHHKERILNLDWVKTKFSVNSDDPNFGRAIFYNRVRYFKGIYYHNYLSNNGKEKVISRIGKELGLVLNIQCINQ
jgi:hypothetical protein